MADDKAEKKAPPTDKERKQAISVQDIFDIRADIERLDSENRKTNELVISLLQGFDKKVIPMLDDHQKVLLALPGQLEQSFSKQTELMKGYIERRMGAPVNEQGAPVQGVAVSPQGVPKGLDISTIIGQVMKSVDQSGGIGGLLGGSRGGTDGEIAVLEREFINRAKLQFRDLLRESLQLPVPAKAATASGPVVVQA